MNDNVKYSVLYSGNDISEDVVNKYLKNGIKVILFLANESINKFLSDQYKPFRDEFFLSVFENKCEIELTVFDGVFDSDNDKETIKILEKNDERFNREQYLTEHEKIDSMIIVSAGAGAGKTHVMVDRTMYLMHCDSEFDFAKMVMITFTNDATDDMRKKLIEKLRSYYILTGQNKYLQKIEEFTNITLSTMDSFFKLLMSDAGCERGFGRDISIKSFTFEKQELIRNVINEKYINEEHSADDKISEIYGLNYHELTKTVKFYWDKLDNYGVSELDYEDMNWGAEKTGTDSNDKRSNLLQGILSEIFSKIGNDYNKLKQDRNAVTIKDSLNELVIILDKCGRSYDELSELFKRKYKYIFCDEFQDSDNMQIRILYVLSMIFDSRLFVVGDVKQSIYRFRGATDAAFEILKNELEKQNNYELVEHTLSKNYRTCENVMNSINIVFQNISGMQSPQGVEYFSYSGDNILMPCKHSTGIYEVVEYKRPFSDREYRDLKKKFINKVKTLVNTPDSGRIVCLTRTNFELDMINKWCIENGILCMISQEGAFYKTKAVRDMCALTEAYLFSEEPKYIWNLINSSYCEKECVFSFSKMQSMNKKQKILYLSDFIGSDVFNKYKLDFRNRPVMAVIRELISEINPVRIYALKRRKELLVNRYSGDIIEQIMIDTERYEADLKKLINILLDTFSGQFASLTDICNFLRLKTETDRDEKRPEPEIKTDKLFVEGYTVHSSKGLQFDNVLIPFMDNGFEKNKKSEIIISKENGEILAGWKYYTKSKDKDTILTNNLFDNMEETNKDETAAEELRLLYVAMTRCKNRLYCFKNTSLKRGNSISHWQDIL